MAQTPTIVLVVLLTLFAACLRPAAHDVPPATGELSLRGSVYVAVLAGRDVNNDVTNYTIEIKAPDASTAAGWVATHPEKANDLRADPPVLGESCWWNLGGDFRCEEPEKVGPYVHALLTNVSYNGTWEIRVQRTENRNWILPEGDPPLRKPWGCMTLEFSDPNKTFIEGPAYEVPSPRVDRSRGISHGTIWFDYSTKNWTLSRDAADTCAE